MVESSTGPVYSLLDTMTAVCHSVLLLLIALTTITFAAQPVEGDVSEGDLTNPGGCISDWRELNKAYLERQSSADVENSVFNFVPSDSINYGVLVVFYDVGPPPNTSTSGRRECCQRGSKDCTIHFIYRFKIFRDIHPRLLYGRIGHRFSSHSSYGTTQLCWAPPPLVIPILLFATVGLFLVLYIHHSWGLVGTVLAQTQVARHTMRSTMLILWAVFVWMMVQFYTANKAMADTIQEERLLTLFQDVYTPQVTAGYVQWGSFLAILFLEAPVLCVFFFRKATDLHNRRQQFSKTNCHLCYWLTVLCDTLGSIGVVTAVQIASVYILYSALYLTVSPTIAITCVSNVLAIVASLLMCTTMLMQMVSSCCKIRSFGRIIKGLAFLLLGLLCIAISGYLIMQVKNDKQSSHDTIRSLLRSVVSSVIIGIYGYTMKRLLFQRKEVEGAERENQELEPLINKGGKYSVIKV